MKKRKNQLWEGKQSQKGKRKKKARESSVGALKCYKKWVTHDHESVNHPWLLAEVLNECVSGFYLGTLALDAPHVSLWSLKIVLLSAQRLRKLAHRPFIGGNKLNHQSNEQREHYGVRRDCR